jgi:hypothetical protein
VAAGLADGGHLERPAGRTVRQPHPRRRDGRRRTLPAPIYALSPDALWALAPDFRRLHATRPGYGYAGPPDPNRDVPAPDDAGIWRTDLRTGRTELLISFRRVAEIPLRDGDAAGATHWFNHLLVAPDGARFSFLHRWKRPGDAGFTTR